MPTHDTIAELVARIDKTKTLLGRITSQYDAFNGEGRYTRAEARRAQTGISDGLCGAFPQDNGNVGRGHCCGVRFGTTENAENTAKRTANVVLELPVVMLAGDAG